MTLKLSYFIVIVSPIGHIRYPEPESGFTGRFSSSSASITKKKRETNHIISTRGGSDISMEKINTTSNTHLEELQNQPLGLRASLVPSGQPSLCHRPFYPSLL
mmetsp:Transcript_35777/g.73118  ORF Transcript_35777/g.73118 Transcript_35777/m.73118 type:complete len:103 (+) Transcript_35777:571-879(+)